MKPEDEALIPFLPNDVDVVSTKNRAFNAKHPGNIYYTDLVQRLVAPLPLDKAGEVKDMRNIAEQIVYHITVERGGRFLKPPDGEVNPTMCVAMEKKQALGKVIHALRTAQSRQGKLVHGVDFVSMKQKKPTAVKGEKKSSPLSSRPKTSQRGDMTLQYQIQASGSTPIPQHTCQLIEAVCNQLVPETAHHILDEPVSWWGQAGVTESETEEERVHRLHLRLRFAGAAAVDMAPLEFASNLLKLWNAKLVLVKKDPPRAERIEPIHTSLD
jgi:hypothetical protein